MVIGKFAGSFLFPNKKYDELVFYDQRLYDKLAVVLPHSSRAGNWWWKRHSKFYSKRLPVIRKYIRLALEDKLIIKF